VRDYVATLERRDACIAVWERFFGEWDALLCPVSVGPAIAHGPSGGQIDVDGQAVPYQVAGTAYCSPFNLSGHPSVVLPLARSADGLPIGLQVVGRRWDEARLLAIARHLVDLIGPVQTPTPPAAPAGRA
jgi:amidase